MGRIDQTFADLKLKGKKAFITFLTAGFPSLELSKKLFLYLSKLEIDLIEIGMPFSDPIADGITIQTSSQIALKNGVTLKWVIKLIEKLKEEVQKPLILMSYLNPIYKFGLKKFFDIANKIQLDGIIIPDLIPEESGLIDKIKGEVNTIYLLAPTTTRERKRLISKKSDGFVYIVSLTGTTGARKKLPSYLPKFLDEVKMVVDKNIVLGFGISSPMQLKNIENKIDGFIIGSALINIILQHRKNLWERIKNFVSEFR